MAGNPSGAPAQTTQPDPDLPAWRKDLPEDIRGHASLSKFETTEGLAKSYVNLERMLGGDKVPVPKDWEDEGQRTMLLDAIRPKAPDEYKLPMPEGIDDEILKTYSKDEESYWRQAFHQAGLSPWQAQKLFEAGVKPRVESYQQSKTDSDNTRQEAVRSLQREWGGAYDANINAARVALKEFAGPEYFAYLDQTGLGNDPQTLRTWAKVGKQIMGDQRLQGGDGGASTPADIETAITEHFSKHQAALMNNDHPEHDLRVKERNTLFNKLYGA